MTPSEQRQDLFHATGQYGVLAQTSCMEVKRDRQAHVVSSYNYVTGAVSLSQDKYDALERGQGLLAVQARHVLIHEHLHGCGPRLLLRTERPDLETLVWGDNVVGAARRGDTVLRWLHELDTELACREFERLEYSMPLSGWPVDASYGRLLAGAAVAVGGVNAIGSERAMAVLASAALSCKGIGGSMSRVEYLIELSTRAASLIGQESLDIARALVPTVL